MSERQPARTGDLGRELISATGLVVLFATVWLAVSLSQCDGRVALVAATLLCAAGLVIAALQRWRLMAHVAVGLGLVGGLVALGADLGALRTCASLAAITTPLLLVALRTPWLDVTLGSIGSALIYLLVFAAAQRSSGMSGPTLAVWDLALAIVGGVGVLISLAALRRGRSAAALAVTTAAGVLICLVPVFGQHVRCMLIPGALVAGFGALYHHDVRVALLLERVEVVEVATGRAVPWGSVATPGDAASLPFRPPCVGRAAGGRRRRHHVWRG